MDQHLIARMAGAHCLSSGKVNNAGVLWWSSAVASADVLSMKLSMAAATTVKSNMCCNTFDIKT